MHRGYFESKDFVEDNEVVKIMEREGRKFICGCCIQLQFDKERDQMKRE